MKRCMATEHDHHTGAILKTYVSHLEVMTAPVLRTTLNPLQTMRSMHLFLGNRCRFIWHGSCSKMETQ